MSVMFLDSQLSKCAFIVVVLSLIGLQKRERENEVHIPYQVFEEKSRGGILRLIYTQLETFETFLQTVLLSF